MALLVAQRCLHHASREAVARCPECQEYFCRECITEHDDRIICSSCLKRLSAKTETRRRSFAPIARVTVAVAGLLIAWVFFFVIGRILVNAPAAFHEGTLWNADWLDSSEDQP